MGRRDITEINKLEAEDAAKTAIACCVLGAFQAIDRQPVIIDPLFPVLRHHAPGGGCMRPVVFHESSLRILVRPLAAAPIVTICRQTRLPSCASQEVASGATERLPNRLRQTPDGQNS